MSSLTYNKRLCETMFSKPYLKCHDCLAKSIFRCRNCTTQLGKSVTRRSAKKLSKTLIRSQGEKLTKIHIHEEAKKDKKNQQIYVLRNKYDQWIENMKSKNFRNIRGKNFKKWPKKINFTPISKSQNQRPKFEKWKQKFINQLIHMVN